MMRFSWVLRILWKKYSDNLYVLVAIGCFVAKIFLLIITKFATAKKILRRTIRVQSIPRSLETDHARPFKSALAKKNFASHGIDHVISQLDGHKATGLTKKNTIQTNSIQ